MIIIFHLAGRSDPLMPVKEAFDKKQLIHLGGFRISDSDVVDIVILELSSTHFVSNIRHQHRRDLHRESLKIRT